MRSSEFLVSLGATAFTGFFLVAVVTMSTDRAFAGEPSAPAQSQATSEVTQALGVQPGTQPGAQPGTQPGTKLSTPCACSRGELPTSASRSQSGAYTPQLDRTPLDIYDEVAALDAVRIALTEVGDGGSYVWQRHHGRLSGVVQPTASFKDRSGYPCRHIVMMLTSTTVSKKTEGIACRLPDGNWQLDG
jgi:surface antigen